MTDRELLELAAKAAGIEIKHWIGSDPYSPKWNPLTDDGDALRLAVKLGGELRINLDEQWASFCKDIDTSLGWFVSDNDPHVATRRAIVRAAAEIEKSVS